MNVRVSVVFLILFCKFIFVNAQQDSVVNKNANATNRDSLELNQILGTQKAPQPQPQKKTSDEKISGRVTDDRGEPIVGAAIFDLTSKKGVNSDVDGNFTLDIPMGSNLEVKYLGYVTQSVKAAPDMQIIMKEESQELDEVIVVAYGSVKRKDYTGSLSSVDTKNLTLQSNSSVSRALEGAVPGVQVSSVDGQPGLDTGIRVRGMGSMNPGNANALIVIDGVPSSQSNILSTLNPKDIASMTVLKDATSSALYGSRGANGVVLVTTKNGIPGKAKVSYEGRFGVNEAGPGRADVIDNPADLYEFAWLGIYNAARFKSNSPYTTNVKNPNMTNEQAALFASQHLFDYSGASGFQRNSLGNNLLYSVPGMGFTPSGSGSNASSTLTGSYLVGVDGKLNPAATLLYYDPIDEDFLESNFRQEHNLSVSGGNDKTDYYISLGYLEDPSYIKGSEFERYNIRGNFNAEVFSWLKAGINTAYSQRTTQSPATRYGRNPGDVTQNVFAWIYGGNQLAPAWAHNLDGSYMTDVSGNNVFNALPETNQSPLGPTGNIYSSADLSYILNHDTDRRKARDFSTRAYATATFLNDFTFTLNLSIDTYDEMRTRYFNGETGPYVDKKGGMGKTDSESNILNFQQLLNWSRNFGKHHVDALLGHEYNRYKYSEMNYNGNYSFIPDFQAWTNFLGMNGIAQFSGTGGNDERTAMESYLFRANYIYDEKYYFSASARRDGSSKFKKSNNRWGTFWSVGGGWRIVSEPFMNRASKWLNELKLRASYGVTGNQNGVSNYSGYQTWSLGALGYTYDGKVLTPTGITLMRNAYVNENLSWEKVYSFDVGLDFRFFNRVFGSIDYYDRRTRDMIWEKPIALSLGQGSLTDNAAKMKNSGIEVELGVDIINNKNLQWTVNVNASHYRTKILEVPEGVGSAELGGKWMAGVEGNAISGTSSTGNNYIYLRGEGEDIYNLYLYKYGGVDQGTGLALYYHKVTEADHTAGRYSDTPVGGDIKTTNYSEASRYEMGSATPDVIGGFSTTLYYKGFDFTAQFAYQIGGKFFSIDYANNLYLGSSISDTYHAISSDLIGNTWTPENPNAKYPMLIYGGDKYSSGSTIGSWQYTDMALFDASYLSVRNLTLGYTLPKELTLKAAMENVRVYASVDNPFYISAKSGVDPRVSNMGGFEVGLYNYPMMRTYNIGISVTF